MPSQPSTPTEWLSRYVTAANERERSARSALGAYLAAGSGLPPTRDDLPARLRELANAIEESERYMRAAYLAGRADFGPGSRVRFAGNSVRGTVLGVATSGHLLIQIDDVAVPMPYTFDGFSRYVTVESP